MCQNGKWARVHLDLFRCCCSCSCVFVVCFLVLFSNICCLPNIHIGLWFISTSQFDCLWDSVFICNYPTTVKGKSNESWVVVFQSLFILKSKTIYSWSPILQKKSLSKLKFTLGISFSNISKYCHGISRSYITWIYSI